MGNASKRCSHLCGTKPIARWACGFRCASHNTSTVERLRLEKASRFLWVDQIYIDQTSNKERGEQVILMNKIYSQSKRIIIWLGEEDEHCVPVEEMLGFFTNDESNIQKEIEIVKKLFAADRGVGKHRQEVVTHLLNRDWFTRVWIFQETVLSKEMLSDVAGYRFNLTNSNVSSMQW